ncbi:MULTISPECIES: hypothetical protein [Vibrio]|nr:MULTISPECIES: hypothetical protein [Vibrio]EJL6401204.1 hypothetical protein [Vibrio navarrensis]EJL6568129.1 hypothetical protein [Vibrio navarrensis]
MRFRKIIILLSLVISSTNSLASSPETKGMLELSFSDGRPSVQGVKNVNSYLERVGVKVTQVSIPKKVQPIIEKSKLKELNSDEKKLLIQAFSLNRAQLLEQIELAGRKPAVHRGGYLSTSEPDVAPYPKVYDMMSMSEDIKQYLQHKFGKLHVNSSEKGEGIDEVMTIISGGHWTWFFVLDDGVVGKLTLGYVDMDSKAWRISYPGLVSHGGFFDADYGLVVAHAHGPEQFIMRYEEPSISWPGTLNGNPWIDFTSDVPVLLNKTLKF